MSKKCMAKHIKMFVAEYGPCPAGMDQSIIFADDMEEAKEYVREYNDDDVIVFVDREPRVGSECRIIEQEIEKGIVYTGYLCC